MNPLLAQLAAALRQRAWMLATAESCTGGMVAAACTSLPGSSDWFERGFVTYSNAAKSELLGVPAALIEQHGAVSIAVAQAMAEGCLRHSRAQISVAVTGIAGPGGGSVAKPVGTVCFAWAWPGGIMTEQKCFAGARDPVRRASTDFALEQLLRLSQMS